MQSDLGAMSGLTASQNQPNGQLRGQLVTEGISTFFAAGTRKASP
jgi:hypothetical protein